MPLSKKKCKTCVLITRVTVIYGSARPIALPCDQGQEMPGERLGVRSGGNPPVTGVNPIIPTGMLPKIPACRQAG